MAELHIKNSSSRPSNHLEVTYILEKRGREVMLLFLMLETNEREKTVLNYDRSR